MQSRFGVQSIVASKAQAEFASSQKAELLIVSMAATPNPAMTATKRRLMGVNSIGFVGHDHSSQYRP
jgi:hypothetical protein